MAEPRIQTELEPQRIVMTVELVCERIETRLPGRGLIAVARHVRSAAGDAVGMVEAINRPILPIRLGSAALVLVIAWVVGKLIFHLRFTDATGWEMLEGIDAGISAAIYLSLMVLFLVTLETRIRRRRALRAIQELRALAHVIDMHQLSKDPEQVLEDAPFAHDRDDNPLAPKLLGRYLDYCADLLSLIGKVAALYAQNTQDGIVLQAVEEVETLTSTMATKIWQKIMILDQVLEIRAHREQPTAPCVETAPGSDGPPHTPRTSTENQP